MKIRFLGCHHMETANSRLASFLIDEILTLDAGAVTSSLTSEEQAQIQAALITHQHLDHVRDLPILGLRAFEFGGSISVLAIPDTLDSIQAHLLNGAIYPDFTQIPSAQEPSIRLVPVTPWKEMEVCGLKVVPIPASHGIPAVGYWVAEPQGGSVFYSGDTDGDGLAETLASVKPDLALVEVTYPNSREDLARQVYHLTPSMLEKELQKLRGASETLPRLVAVHLNPLAEEEIVADLALLAHRLGVPITPAQEGMVLEV